MKKERAYTILAAAFCVCLIASNIFETIIFEAGPLTLTGGFLVFPIIYIINDCLSEVYGYSKTRLVIFLAFALNLAFVLLAQLVAILPESGMSACLSEVPESGMSSHFSELPGSVVSSRFSDADISPQRHFAAVFRFDLRITIASMAAFLVGSLVNARVMVAMKKRLLNRFHSSSAEALHSSSADFSAEALHSSSVGVEKSVTHDDAVSQSVKGFGFRAILSTLAGESLDSLIFFPIAFFGLGIRSIFVLMITQIVLKTAYELLVLPLTTIFVKHLN